MHCDMSTLHLQLDISKADSVRCLRFWECGTGTKSVSLVPLKSIDIFINSEILVIWKR